MTNKKTQVGFSGLATYPSPLGAVPAGACQILDNVVIDRQGAVTPRKGQAVFASYTVGGAITAGQIQRVFQFGEDMVLLVTSEGVPGSFLVVQHADGSVTGVNQSLFWPNGIQAPVGNPMRAFQANGALYIVAQNGLYKLATPTSPLVPAGMSYALDSMATLAAPPGGANGFLAGDNSTAYRVVYGYTDANGVVILGAPSPRAEVTNLGRDVTVVQQTFSTPVSVFAMSVTYPAAEIPTTSSTVRGYVVQGSAFTPASISSTGGSATATISLDNAGVYFGATGSPVSVVAPNVVVGVPSGTTLTFRDAGPVAATAAPGDTIFQGSNLGSAPADTSGATAVAIVTAVSGLTVTVANTAGFVPGPINVIKNASVALAQGTSIAISSPNGLTAGSPANLTVSIPGIANPVQVVSTNDHGTGTVDSLTLGTYPVSAQLTIPGAGLATVTLRLLTAQAVSVVSTVPGDVVNYINAGLNVFVQLYRSSTQQPVVADVVSPATDNMQLAFQEPVPANATTITIFDISPDATLGTFLYTSPNEGDGILASNYQPPPVSDAIFNSGSAMLANAFSLAQFSSEVLGVSTVPATNAMANGDTITLGGFGTPVVFTAKTSPTNPHDFKLVAGGSSAAADINATVFNFCQQVNLARISAGFGDGGGQITALPTGSDSSLPGTFVIQVARGLGQFTVAFSKPASFAQLPINPITAQAQPNYLYFSKTNQPEAVPLLNSIQVGIPNYPIQRILAVPGSCNIFKNDGIFTLTGTTPADFATLLFNTTAVLIGNETAVALQSSIIAYTSQGVITLSPGGVQILSMAINDDLHDISNYPAFRAGAFAVAHEAERRYMLWCPSTPGDTFNTQAYVYNVITNAWSRWSIARACGLVSVADNLLYTASVGNDIAAVAPVLYKERDTGGDTDFGDDEIAGTVAILNPTQVSFTPTNSAAALDALATLFLRGSSLAQTAGQFSVNSAAASDTSLMLTLDSTQGVIPGTGTLRASTVCKVTPVPVVPDDPGTVKRFQELVASYVGTATEQCYVNMTTDFNRNNLQLLIAPLMPALAPAADSMSGWGTEPWGAFGWGDTGATGTDPVQESQARQLVPRDAARGHSLTPAFTFYVANNKFELVGLTLAWNPSATLRMR